MGWKRMLTNGVFGDKKKVMAYDKIRCPFGVTCPSHIPFKNARPAKIKFIERVSPNVYKYQCRWCGCSFIYDAVNPDKVHHSELSHVKNRNFLTRRF